MSSITKMKGTIVLLFGLILIIMSGCSKQNSKSSVDPDTGKHTIVDWANADIHGAWAKKPSSEGGFASCQECHGSDFSGGNSKTACSSCHGVSAPHPGTGSWASASGARTHQTTDESNAPVCAGCHTNGANSPILAPTPPAPAGTAPGCFNNTLCHGAGHPAGWAAADQHGASAKAQANGFSGCQSCHGTLFDGGTATISCYTCHGVSAPHPPTPWITSVTPTLTHTTTNTGNAAVCAGCHTGGANLISIPTPTPAPPAGTPAGCFNNTLCHAQLGHAVGWVSADVHGAAAKSAPSTTNVTGFSTCQTCHGVNFAGGTATTCLNTGICHGAGVDSPHAFPWQSTSTRKHSTTNEANASACGLCHLANRQPPTYAPLAVSVGCFDGTLCHATAGSLGCIDCHNGPQPSLIAQGLGGPATRRDIVTEMKNTWSHKRSSAGGVPANTVVTNEDCIVCHMEGDRTSGTTTAVHKDGYVDLRDPDTGLHIKNVTWNGSTPGAYVEGATDLRFVQFSRDLGVKLESDPNWLVIAAIQQNHCLKCHDTGGATNSNAQVATGGTALKPFGTTIAHVANTIMNNAIGSVYDVKSNFLTTNASYHPVSGRQNNSYADIDTMTAPYNQASKTARVLTAWGDLISCWDCHAAAGASGAQAGTVTAHGGAATLRAPAFAGGATAALNLCLVCHKATLYPLTTRHSSTLSAFSGGASNMSATTMASCHNCHSNYQFIAATNRPIRAEDVHGFNARNPLTANSKQSSGSRPYAFWRTTRINSWSPASATGDTLTETRMCNDNTGTTGTGSCGNNMDTAGNVGVGGVY